MPCTRRVAVFIRKQIAGFRRSHHRVDYRFVRAGLREITESEPMRRQDPRLSATAPICALLLLLCAASVGTADHPTAAETERGAPLIQSFEIGRVGGSGYAWITVQAPDGSLYFGCDAILRYDGSEWSVYPAGRGSNFRALAFDASGRLWVGGSDELGFFPPTHDGLGEFVSLRERVPPAGGSLTEIWDVVATPSGVFFASIDAVLRWDGEQFRVWQKPGLRRLRLMQSGGHLFLYGPQGLERFNGSDWDTLLPRSKTIALGFEWLEARGDELLILGRYGIHRYRDGVVYKGTVPILPRGDPAILANACRFDGQNIVAAIINQGIALLNEDGHRSRLLGLADGLPNLNVNSVFVDRDGAIWTTSSTHLARIGGIGAVSYFGAAHGVTDPVHRFTQLNGRIVALSAAGGTALRKGTNGQAAGFEPVPSLSGLIFDATPLEDGRLLVSGFGRMFTADWQARVPIPRAPDEALSFYPSRSDPRKFLLNTPQGIFQLEPGKPAVLIATVPGNRRTIAEDKSGNLWVASDSRGLFFFRRVDDRYEPAAVPPGLPADSARNRVTTLGDFVLALTDDRTFGWRPGQAGFTPIPELDGFRVGASSPAAAGEARWAVLSRQFSDRISFPILAKLTASGATVRTELFEVPGLARVGQLLTVHADGDERDPRLWVGGTSGVLRVELNSLKPAVAPRPPTLRPQLQFELPGHAPAAATVLPFASNQLAFALAVHDFGRREQLRFQTRLVGLESAWSAPTLGAHREYPFLEEGTYRFEARTLSPAGLASTVTAWDFTVLPPWWRTPWAYAGYALAGCLLLLGADRVRIRAMRRRTAWLEQQVKVRTAELEKANAAKTEFVARVNHDIRNPINGVLGLTLTLEQTPLSDEQRRITGTIKQCAKFLASLVEEVLDFAEIESGALKIRTEPFNLREALAASVATIDPLAQAAGCTVHVEVDPNLPAQLAGDAARIQQILVNFLSNAVKFGAGRPVALTARAGHQLGQHLYVRLAVRDQGPGLSEAERLQLFRKFSRLRFAEEHKIKGTGLGLAVCRLLGERMGGRVDVVSEPGSGAEFFLEVPLALASAASPEPLLSALATSARVLVVEDEDYNAVSLLAMLKGMGLRAERCADGPSALAQLQRERYDIVFLDWDLPGLNGIEVARRYRASEPADRRALIIATTAYASADKREACRQAGMDEFVSKPVTPDRIATAIRGPANALAPASPILDREEPSASGPDLSLFTYLADDDATVGQKVAEFIATCEKELAELEASAAAGRGDELRRGAHRFLSQCRFIGATRLADLALELEQRSDDPSGPAVRQLLESLGSGFAALKNELRSGRGARGAAESVPSRSRIG